MSPESYQPDKLFTVDEANATLPLVRAIVGDIVKLSRELVDRRQRLDHLNVGREREEGNPYSEELAEIERQLEKDELQLQEYADELKTVGAELKSAIDGLVDFPSEMDGRTVYLCWSYDEPELLFWHDLDAGFAGRQPLTADSVADGDPGQQGDFHN